ncbi:MAG: PQQ-binding-like beta-propeller repeat protein, partial [Candidatus Sumerlaeota bacterium]|nr:PQQ-binding-like beta-propeller repeat protein [Candidatus Sumerlaeota bacterium]
MIGRCRAVSLILMALPCLGLAGKLPAASAPASPVDAAKQILETSGIRGGLIVLVGCGDGALVAALSAAKGFLTQGLDVDPARVQKAREAFDAAGLTERASATAFDGEHLPYADNMVNLLVLDDRGRVNDAEIQRVLCPYGVACARTGGAWAVIARKPWPADMDEWSHYLHGPDGNPVANDTQVGPPDHLKWDAGPEVCKSHSILPSVQAAVSAGGRVFSIADEGPIPLPHILPARWALTARDAFNGTLLWQRPLDVWQAINAQKRGLTPTDLARRLVADHDRVYVTLDIFGPFQALDAATGKTLQVYKETEFAEEAILRDGVLYIVAEAAPPDIGLRRQLGIALPQPVAKRLLAVRADTGQVLWNKCDDDTFGLFPLTLAAGDHGLCFQTDKAICCLDPASGSKVWQTPHPAHYPRPGWSAPTLVAQGDIVLCADGGTTDNAKERAGSVVALSAATGQPLWSGEAAEGASSPVDVFVSQGLAWIGEQKARNAQDYMHGRDLLTGAVTREIPPSDAWTGEHHHRCYRDKATGQYILAGRTGVEFIDLKSGEILPHPWIRGTCHYGIMPCNGLLYVMPHECGCYLESKLNGFLALAPKGAAPAFTPPADARLEKGPAYGKIDVRPASSAAGASSDWPTFRHDNARSGYAPSPVPAALGQVWSADLGGGLTAPVCADGRLYVAQKDRNAVACLDAATGKTVWRYIAGASVDSPPTIADGLA